MSKQRPSFSREFKLEAVRLMNEGKKPPAEPARELVIRVSVFLEEDHFFQALMFNDAI